MKILRWIKDRLSHKLSHFSIENIKKFIKENGLAFVVIFIVWEIVEDVVFPAIFIWLGTHVNPWFLTGAPISWIICLHPVAVPALWGIWLFLKGKKNENKYKGCEDDHCGGT